FPDGAGRAENDEPLTFHLGSTGYQSVVLCRYIVIIPPAGSRRMQAGCLRSPAHTRSRLIVLTELAPPIADRKTTAVRCTANCRPGQVLHQCRVTIFRNLSPQCCASRSILSDRQSTLR